MLKFTATSPVAPDGSRGTFPRWPRATIPPAEVGRRTAVGLLQQRERFGGTPWRSSPADARSTSALLEKLGKFPTQFVWDSIVVTLQNLDAHGTRIGILSVDTSPERLHGRLHGRT